MNVVPSYTFVAPFPPQATKRRLVEAVDVGSEVARKVALTLATVRRSNVVCGFPAPRFHEDTNYEIRRRPYRVGPAPHLSG